MSDAADSTSTESSRRQRAYVAPPDRLITVPFVTVTVSAFAFFMYIGTLLPLIPLYIEGPLDGGEFGVGVNAAVFAVAAVVARPLLGRIADRYGRRVIMIGGAFIASTGGFGMSQISSLGALLGFRALTGIGEAAMFVGAATLIADLSPRHRRAEGASYFSVAVFTGLGVGPVFGEWLLDDTQFERTFVAAGCFAIAAGLIALFVPSRVVSPDAQTGDDVVEPDAPPRRGIGKYVHPAAVFPGTVLALGVGGLTSFFLFIPDFSRTVGLGSSGGLFLVYSVVSVLIRIFGATLPERLGPRRAVTMALGFFVIGLVIVGTFATAPSLWVGAVFIGLGAAFNYPSLMALTVNRVSDADRAVAISSFTMFFEIGSAVSGLFVGALAQLVSERSAFFAGAAMCVVGIWVLRTKVVPLSPATDQVDYIAPGAA
ncbi:MFS transporter [Ilumatobacter coccineus]|uniref:Putative major facilitator superfamily transporter n=1 Tax=Ilumatobacter coccineus (strain NBRC 103263 / KCTC 29153 / YM16-304) TaxID=1313172 RepID=A0A6C7E7Z6_ILUCY|nr:MFS transporter [Ilumatobacter coccineus]BAN01329.1 putative major facilitator superfamily transporter [Ilumatobacter coccineus YM16-304]